ncbi:MAG: sulfatase-like hydrolase/transferase [Planctomycetota bacterium]|jgi:uncharacterized sulfatase
MESLNRREFLILAGGGAAAALAGCERELAGSKNTTAKRPNILWISTEDISCDLGCYGDSYAVTPNIDAFAAQGVRYNNVYSHSGVCAPTRSGIITGMYPTTIGTGPMRCKGVPPGYVKCFSEYLRAAGYYCTNNVKTDYQFAPPLTAWDENSRKAHWRGRGKDQPFFAIFNFTVTHESQIRNRSEKFQKRLATLEPHEKHNPAKAVLPPYYPDTPAVRKDWAQYYDIITLMDRQFADVLKQLEEDGLADDTIVWFWGDHGRGLPRAKRWIYDSGLKIPLIIRIPEKFRKLAMPKGPGGVRPGRVNDDLIAFIDFAPTMLSLAGVKIPDYIQGRAFLGSQKIKARRYIFAARDRMDEAYDIIRAVRDKRFKYIRNYMAHLTYGQDIEYMNMMPTMQEMRRLNAEGKLVGPQKQYFRKTKPIEELYDTLSDPHEVNNLASKPKYKNVLERMRKVHQKWMKETCDVGLIPEPEFDEMKRPGSKWQDTAEPTFSKKDNVVSISCATAGASIAYKINSEGKVGWKLYTKPVVLRPDQVLIAKACRIGFKDSKEVRFELGDKTLTAKHVKSADENIPHWKEQLDKTDLLERLRAIKNLDGLGKRAIPKYFEALNDKYGSVRYWAVMGLQNNCDTDREVERAKQAIGKLLEDRSPIVRIAAAETMCNWDNGKEALGILVEMLGHESGSVRVNAAIALDRIGEKARPVISHIKAALKDPDGYVQRVTRHTLQHLQNGQ